MRLGGIELYGVATTFDMRAPRGRHLCAPARDALAAVVHADLSAYIDAAFPAAAALSDALAVGCFCNAAAHATLWLCYRRRKPLGLFQPTPWSHHHRTEALGLQASIAAARPAASSLAELIREPVERRSIDSAIARSFRFIASLATNEAVLVLITVIR